MLSKTPYYCIVMVILRGCIVPPLIVLYPLESNSLLLLLSALQEKAATGSAKRQSVEEELLKVKNALQQREVEVAVMATKLGDKDLELRNVLSQWDDRETDLAHFRDEVSTEANSLAKLDQLKQAMQETEAAANANASGSKLDPLELEVSYVRVRVRVERIGLTAESDWLLDVDFIFDLDAWSHRIMKDVSITFLWS